MELPFKAWMCVFSLCVCALSYTSERPGWRRISAADGSMVGDRGRGQPVLRGPPVTSPAAARRPAASSGQLSQQAVLSGSSYQGDSMSAQPRSAAEGGRVRRRGASREPDASPALMGLSILLRSRGSWVCGDTHRAPPESQHIHTPDQQKHTQNTYKQACTEIGIHVCILYVQHMHFGKKTVAHAYQDTPTNLEL